MSHIAPCAEYHCIKCYATGSNYSTCLITGNAQFYLYEHFTTFRYASILSPYSKAVPAVIAKASAIYNPFIYAIIHSKYR